MLIRVDVDAAERRPAAHGRSCRGQRCPGSSAWDVVIADIVAQLCAVKRLVASLAGIRVAARACARDGRRAWHTGSWRGLGGGAGAGHRQQLHHSTRQTHRTRD